MFTYAMIGGGRGAFIGAVHRMALALDGRARLVAGALSSDPARALESGRDLGLPEGRSHGSWRDLVAHEAARRPSERVDFAVIVTPNHAHAEPAVALLRAGIPVVIDKPLARSLDEALEIEREAARAGLPAAVTYNYTGYPMVRAAGERVRAGALGEIRKVVVEYHQGWLARAVEREGQKQASWRTDPALAGAGALGDIGTHAENLVSTVTGLEIESLSADVSSLVPGRRVDDDAGVLLRFRGGARGVMSVSQVAAGEENNLTLRVYGSEGSLSWRQESPNELVLTPREGSRRVVTRGSGEAGPSASRATRLPPGHPEGFHEAFANVYRGFLDDLAARRTGHPSPDPDYPTVSDGVRGVRFVEACLASARAGGTWTGV